ncbi:uncharacterized protein VTP21DRAFT_7029 [Calcarisporiella thermophila]|uniref:uncharacterized protein n=1 Tax=Calcarisporiella thermophila TaxID=911321 RepID=UPI003744823F
MYRRSICRLLETSIPRRNLLTPTLCLLRPVAGIPSRFLHKGAIIQATGATSLQSRGQIPFTADKYPGFTRNPQFKKLDDQDLAFFRSVLTESNVLVNDDEVEAFNMDWMRKYRGQSQAVLRPKTTKQVSQIIKYCNDNNIAVVPQGGNTGLVGGSVPVFDEVIISMSNLSQIRSFDAISGALVCDAGCVLENLDNYLAEKGYIMPIDLGAKGSCHIGGNVATNAGGLRLLRYGSLHGTVLGLEVVLPDGTVLDNLSTLRKDNTGYDLKQLFIGSEGTLGIITGVSILTPKRPKAVNVAFLGLNSFEDVQKTYLQAKDELSEILSAFEFWDQEALSLVKSHLVQGARYPLESEYPFYVLIETSGSSKEHDDAKLSNFLENILENSLVQDGVLAQDTTQIQNLWSIREGLPEACAKAGATYKYDISMPVPVFYQMVEDMRKEVEKSPHKNLVKGVVGYGHVGDGNLHLNVVGEKFCEKVTNIVEPFVYEWTAKHKGSISAEHGVGLMKAAHLHYSKSDTTIALMKQLKGILDPKGILNPYKMLPK